MDAVDAKLANAIPALGARTPPRHSRGVDTAPDERIWPIIVKAFPYLNRYIAGRWRHWGAALPADRAPEGLGFMPVLLTLFAALWAFGGLMAPARAGLTPQQLGIIPIAVLLGGAAAILGWLCWALKGRGRTVVAVILIITALLAGMASLVAPVGIAGKAVGLAMVLTALAGWGVRIRVGRERGVSLRTESHILYFYIISFISGGVTLATTAFTLDILYTGILAGQPLQPGVAALLGHPELAQGPTLSAALRTTLQWQYLWITLAVWFIAGLPFAMSLPYYAVWIHQAINQDLRLDLLDRWTQLSPRYHARHRVGDSIYRLIQDSAGIVNILDRLYMGAAAITGIAQALFLICFFDWRIAALGLGMIASLSLLAAWYSRPLKARAIAMREAQSDLTSTVQEILSGLRVTKAYRQELREQARFEAQSVAAFDAALRTRWLFTGVGVIAFVLMGAFLIPGDVLPALWAHAGRPVAAGALMALIGLTYSRWNLAATRWVHERLVDLAQAIRGLNSEWASAQDNSMALRRVFDILETQPEITDPATPMPIHGFEREIRFEDVSFAYDPDRPVLSGVSFTAAPGSVTAIVGPTGSGKSTLMALLLRVFDPDRGRITIDGADLRDLAVDDLRAQIAVAPQEPLLFARSVLENVRYAAPEADLEAVAAACQVACADEVVAGLPDGHDSVLGDRGAGLSTGQKQRLCIARAVVRGSPIVILDEPTAALDAETEHKVMSNLAAWGAGRAIFVITHRLSTVRRADQILFLEGGRLAEQGSHETLMSRSGGRYRAMVETEMALAREGAPA